MIISHIVAAGEDNEIGKSNQLLWHLPNDLKFFKNTTWGMPIVMGRKTYESIAGEPLPGRLNIILTQQKDFDPKHEKALVVNSFEDAIRKASESDVKELFVAGGGEIYRNTLAVANRIYMTRVHDYFPDAEIFYPEIRNSEWKKIKELYFQKDEKHKYSYTFEIWER